MQSEIATRLVQLNQEFYQTFGQAFSRTRMRIQPGVRRFLEAAPKTGRWLDIGCGNGYLAVEWSKLGFSGDYLGMDFSNSLLNEARSITAQNSRVQFGKWDLTSSELPLEISGELFDGVMAFAVLHHLPGKDQRLKLLKLINGSLNTEGIFVHSEWQFQHSPKLMQRVQPWSLIGIADTDVDAGDYLLDWRYALPGQKELTGLRYVHMFDSNELRSLADESGFFVQEEWLSDGQGGKLSLYQVWRKP